MKIWDYEELAKEREEEKEASQRREKVKKQKNNFRPLDQT